MRNRFQRIKVSVMAFALAAAIILCGVSGAIAEDAPYSVSYRETIEIGLDESSGSPTSLNIPSVYQYASWPIMSINGGTTETASRFNALSRLSALDLRLLADQLDAWYSHNPINDPDSHSIDPYYQSEVRFSIGLAERGIISVCYQTYSESGGAHGLTQVHTLNFDIAAGKQLDAFDYVSDYSGFTDFVNQFVINEIQKDPGAYFEQQDDDALLSWYPTQRGCFTREGLVIAYSQGDIAAMAAGVQYFLIPYADIRPFLNEAGLELFAFAYDGIFQTEAALSGHDYQYRALGGERDDVFPPGYSFTAAVPPLDDASLQRIMDGVLVN